MLFRVAVVALSCAALTLAACDSEDEEDISQSEGSSSPSPRVTDTVFPTASPSTPPVTPTSTPMESPIWVRPTTNPAFFGAIEAARTKWDTAGIGDYRYDLTLGCFCGTQRPVIVVVQDSGGVSRSEEHT